MKKIISIFLVLALFVSCFAGTLTISAEDTAVNEDSKMKFGIGITVENDYEAEIIEAKNLGSNIIRVSEPDDHDYTRLLKVIDFAEQHGMDIILNCDHINYEFLYDKEASVAAGKRLPYDTSEEVDVEAIKEHYTTLYNAIKGRVDYWKFGNELDNWYYIGGEQGRVYNEDCYLDVASAATALNAASEAIKALDANAKTMINFGWLHYGFLDGLAQKGFSWDVSGLDWYSSGSYDEVNGPNGTVNQFDYGDVINHLAETFVGRDIIICETGLAPSGLDENGEVIYIGDAQWLGGMINDIKTNYADKVSAVAVFKLNDPVSSTDEEGNVVYDKEDYYGIIDANGNKKAAYYAVQEAFGGSDDWYILGGGDVEDIYDTHYKANAQDCFDAGIRVSDYAETVGSRVLYYPTDTSLNGNLWTLRYGLNDGVNAFEYDGNVSDGVYTINAVTKWAGDNGLKYEVAANTELHIPIVVPTDAISILDYYKYEVSFDNGKTWSAITPNVVETRAFKVSTGFNSTMTVYSVSLYEACHFRVLFPQIWYDETITENSDTPKGRGDSPYDLLYSINVGNLYNAAMYMLPVTAYGFDTISAGDTDVFTATADKCYGSTIFYANSATDYATINGTFVKMDSSNISGWIYDDYGKDYSLEGKTYVSPTASSGVRYIDYRISPDTVIEFDIALWSAIWTAMGEKGTSFSFMENKGNGFVAVDESAITYTENANATVRTYRYYTNEGCTLRITCPDMSLIAEYVDTNKPANQSSNIIFRGAFLISAPTAKGILADGVSDVLTGEETVKTQYVTNIAYTFDGSAYSDTSSYTVCRTLVNAATTWVWKGITELSACADIDGKYVYTPCTGSSFKDTVPYVDYYVSAGTKVILPFGMFDEMWENHPDVKFEIGSLAGTDFAEISAEDITVVSESAQMQCKYDGTETTKETDPLSGYWSCTVKTYSIAIAENGILRVYWPDTVGNMQATSMKYYNEAAAFLSRTGAFIIPPTAESIDFGDVNSDSAIDVRDLVCLKKATANVEGLVYDKLAANVDGVSGVKSGDLAVLRQFLIGIIKNFK